MLYIKLCIKIFFTFFKIGIFGFGGGYSMLPLIHNEIVYVNKWLEEEDFIDIVAISQITPGPIIINSATYVGYKKAGIIGSIMATMGVIMPSIIIILIVFFAFSILKDNKYMKYAVKGLRPVTIGLMAAACYLMFDNVLVITDTIKRDSNPTNYFMVNNFFIDYKAVLIFVIALILMMFVKKVNPIVWVFVACFIGFVVF